MPAILQKPTLNQTLDCEHLRFVKCTHCEQRFVLAWNDKELNAVYELDPRRGPSAEQIRATRPPTLAFRYHESEDPRLTPLPSI